MPRRFLENIAATLRDKDFILKIRIGVSFLLMLGLFCHCVSVSAAQKTEAFLAPWWCRGGHFQTMAGDLLRDHAAVQYRRERLELPDGDFLDLDWSEGEPEKPVAVIFYGLASSSQSGYVKVMTEEVRKKGWTAAIVNHRGLSGEPNRLKQTFHAGRSQDVDWAVRHIMKSKPNQPLFLIGYSIGGNALLKWLGENAGFLPPQVKRAAAVSVPYDLERTAGHLDHDFIGREIYTRLMLNKLKPIARQKARDFPGSISLEELESAKTFKVYDHIVTAHLNGFDNEVEYWTKSSSKNFLGAITVPTLLIHAQNDPFLPGSELPYREMLQSPNLKLILTQDGGHLGFVTGESPWKRGRWLESVILSFFSGNH